MAKRMIAMLALVAVFIAALGFVNYILLRLYGARGILLTDIHACRL